ncbi:Acyl-CoA synthetase (AMP-forming)/AMP-acid ligase II [Niastella yeongjuensis]|nr:Acyl-CoA synthetase (AMP-forming)/AMP-acid ligase II [Niastella yeongjuensis]
MHMHIAQNSIVDYLFHHADDFPAKSAFTILQEDGSERTIKYRELAAAVKTLAAQWKRESLAGTNVLLIYQDIPEFIIAFLACQYAGIIAVPVPYLKGTKRVARLLGIMEDAQAAAVFCTLDSVPHLERELTANAPAIRIIPTSISDAINSDGDTVAAQPNEISFIQYTSGSTGSPKGVVVTAQNLLHNQQLIKNTFGCDRDAVIFSWLPFHHDMGLIGNILHTVYVGCRCVLMSPYHFIQTPLKWLKAISHYRVTHSGAPNFAYDLCVEKIPPAELQELDLSSWRVAYNGSEPVRYTTLQRFAAYFEPAGFKPEVFYPCYGLAEATLLVAGIKESGSAATIAIEKEQVAGNSIRLTNKSDAQAQIIVTSGSVPEGMEVRIIAPGDGKTCGELEEGEICISGDSVTRGYWNKDNSSTFYRLDQRQFLRTGDLGFFYNGQLFVRGRLTDMLIIRGRNIYPYDIEQLVAGCDAAVETNGVAAFCVDKPGGELVIVAEIKRAFVQQLNTAALIATIARAVSGTFGTAVHDILLLAPLGIPRTTSGKLQRVKCREFYQAGDFNPIASLLAMEGKNNMPAKKPFSSAGMLQQPNAASIKKYLIGIIGSTLGNLPTDELQDTTELTQIGIDSLKATELINMINRDLSIHIDVANVFGDNRIAGLVNTIEQLLWLKNEQSSGEEITI